VFPGALFTCAGLGGVDGYLFHDPSALNMEGGMVFSFLFLCSPDVVIPTQMYMVAPIASGPDWWLLGHGS
jgi:hypothetical protein